MVRRVPAVGLLKPRAALHVARARRAARALRRATLVNMTDHGRTLRDVIDRTQALTGSPIERAYVDKGWR
jgi:transposase, IS5 family